MRDDSGTLKYANEVIVISEVINTLIQTKHGRYNANVIYNGVRQPQLPAEEARQATLDQYSLGVLNTCKSNEERWKLASINLSGERVSNA